MLALQARPSLPGLSDASQVEVLLADEVPEDPPAPNHTWRTSLRNALPNALPWRRWQAPSKPLNTIPDQQSNEVLQGKATNLPPKRLACHSAPFEPLMLSNLHDWHCG